MAPVGEQFQSFFFTVILGFILGVTIDGYRSMYHLWRPRPLIMTILDLLFWLIVTGAVFFLLLLSNWGEVRAYVLIGMGAGLLIYGRWCSAYVFTFWRRFHDLLRRFVRTLFVVLWWPVGLGKRVVLWPWRLLAAWGRPALQLPKHMARKLGLRRPKWPFKPKKRWWHKS